MGKSETVEHTRRLSVLGALKFFFVKKKELHCKKRNLPNLIKVQVENQSHNGKGDYRRAEASNYDQRQLVKMVQRCKNKQANLEFSL